MSIRIYVDSAADLEAADYKTYNIGLVPLTLTVDQRTYTADEKFNKVDFFRLLEASDLFPTTSQPAPSVFEAIFEEARLAGDQVIFISVSSALSGTWQCANVVKEMGEYDNVFIVDSRAATLCIKELALQAVKLRDAGVPVREIVSVLEALKSRIRIYAGLDTLEYLRRGGRLSSAAASIGALARIKPVVTLNADGTGGVNVAAKCMGKGRAMKEIAELLTKHVPDPEYPIFGVYAGNSDNLLELEARIAPLEITIPQENHTCIGPIIGSHIGPGAYGIAYVEQLHD